MIQFDDSGSNSVQHHPLQHASKHAPSQQPITESEEEIKTQERELLNPQPARQRSTSGSPIIYEEPLIIHKKHKKDKLMEKNIYESNSDSDSGDSSDTSSTSETNEDNENNTSENDNESESSENDHKKRKGIKRKTQKMPKQEVKKRKKQTQKKKKPVTKKRKTKQNRSRETTVYKKTKKLIEKALKDLKKIK